MSQVQSYDSYVAIALQPRTYGCRNKRDVGKNLANACNLIDEAMYPGPLAGGAIKLVTLTEGSIQGMWDEYSDMDQAEYCREVAITVPGPETEKLAEKAKHHNIYLVAQAKVIEPDIMPDRYFNTGFIISPQGEIILKHRKNLVHTIEGTTTPYDVWDAWSTKVGSRLESFYPVVKTEIGNLAIAICAETFFPETFRAFCLMGAEVIIKMAWAEPLIMDGYWEVMNRARALDNLCYIIASNFGPYYTHPDVDAPYTLAGGHTMIVDYRGNIVRKADHGNEAFVPGEINLKGLRKYRLEGGIAVMMAQMRSSLWKQIYEQWPEYPKNLYLKKTISKARDRNELHKQIVRKFVDAGIYTADDEGRVTIPSKLRKSRR
ncbi:MAG TPA: nitrilase-related carbon-nitrogen hydrolase [Thermodesulfobacteriota bacterium]|nr:nitrilase-related carbon-nitrogen hydrolase [Thermodesulfobacteriota bacterium]